MEKVAKFELVSQKQFTEGYLDCFPSAKEGDALAAYRALRLPRRATAGSAGYDFFTTADVLLRPGETAKIPTGIRARIADGWFLAILPAEFTLKPSETVKIPTGIRVEMQPEWVLKCYPRSGLGFKYRLQLNNTVGVVDSDYYRSDNEGHIFVKITNDSKEGKILELPAGSGFAQGIFLPFGITEDDEAEGVRNGGFGSTGK